MTMADLDRIERIIVELVARCREDTPDNVLRDLRAGGEGLPVSSIEMIEILVDLGERVGVRVPPNEVTADDLRSVRTLAAHVRSLLAGPATGAMGA